MTYNHEVGGFPTFGTGQAIPLLATTEKSATYIVKDAGGFCCGRFVPGLSISEDGLLNHSTISFAI